jgi:hypothetical protein
MSACSYFIGQPQLGGSKLQGLVKNGIVEGKIGIKNFNFFNYE